MSKLFFYYLGLVFIGSSSHADIIGNYLDDMDLPTVCRFDVKVDQDKRALCTGTLVEGRFVMTARHCVENLVNSGQPLPKLICSTEEGRRVEARQVVDIRIFKPSNDQSRETMETIEDAANDVAMMSLEKEPFSADFINDDAIRLVKSKEEQDKLIASKKCLFTGWGQENLSHTIKQAGGKSGLLHTVLAPNSYIKASAKTVDSILGAIQIMNLGSGAAVNKLSALRLQAEKEVAEVILYGGLAYAYDAKIRTTGKNISLEFSIDSGVVNGTAGGDSGGPLVCIDEQKHFVQLGVTSGGKAVSLDANQYPSVPQSVFTLLGRAEILSWIKKNLATML